MKRILFVVVALFALTVVARPVEAGFRYRGGNRVEIKNVCKTEVNQTNVSTITNVVNAVSNTGGNSASFNTTKSGDVNVSAGNATTTVTISNTTGGNVAVVSGCCCGGCGNVCSDPGTPCQQ
jgi:hypothetical protein